MQTFQKPHVRCTAPLLAVLLLFTIFSAPALAEDDDLEKVGDILQFAIPAAGFFGTYAADDPEGRIQFWETYLSSIAITTVAKGVYEKVRPKSESATSFPSGHTTSAFAGAAFIQQRYGWLWGSIAYAGAALTGYSRVDAQAHFGDDVLAGASVGLFNSWYWVDPFKSDVMLLPLVTDDGLGVSLVIQDPAFTKKEEIKAGKRRPRFGYRLDWGGAFLKENKIRAPSDGGTEFDLADFNKRDYPLTSAVGIFDWYAGKRHTVSLGFWPLESRDNGTFQQDTNFNGVIFPAGTFVQSRWRHYQGFANYAFEFLPDSSWILKAGAGLTYQYTKLEIANENNSLSSEVSDQVLLPLIHLDLGYRITDRWNVQAIGNGMYLDSDQYIDARLETNYLLGKHWRFGGGVGRYGRKIETSELFEEFQYDIAYLTLTYLFY